MRDIWAFSGSTQDSVGENGDGHSEKLEWGSRKRTLVALPWEPEKPTGHFCIEGACMALDLCAWTLGECKQSDLSDFYILKGPGVKTSGY